MKQTTQPQKNIFTIGHSTRLQHDLIELLKFYNVDTLLDIRAIPFSRYNPQFNREELAHIAPLKGLTYEHLQELGGKRPAQEVMAAAKSCSDRSRGFAGYMNTAEFRSGINHVLALLAEGRTIAMMCAEANPAHCHRFWVADALSAEGITVRHIVSETDLRDHPANLFTNGMFGE